MKDDVKDLLNMTADSVGRDLLGALVTEIKLLPDVWQKLSEAKQNSLMAACGIAPEDDDGNAAAAASKKQEEQPDAPPVDLEMIRQSIENAPNLEVLQAHFKAAWLQLDKGQRDAIKPTYDARKAQLIATEGATE